MSLIIMWFYEVRKRAMLKNMFNLLTLHNQIYLFFFFAFLNICLLEGSPLWVVETISHEYYLWFIWLFFPPSSVIQAQRVRGSEAKDFEPIVKGRVACTQERSSCPKTSLQRFVFLKLISYEIKHFINSLITAVLAFPCKSITS